MKKNSPYNGSLTREQFLFYEMRITAGLLLEGKTEQETIRQIVVNNLFQYPTEREIKKMAKVCLSRLQAMNDSTLVEAVVTQSSDVAKQICLYAIIPSAMFSLVTL